ncbi:hypothetical protein DACRYDRAFT_105308 [Dacryopinax primogenitus]|uniref:NADH-ubiquinone oxidoreductase B12 subunit n=1 Tax=Dacryopinax primogenitus (strain DJM 731) TaxID=1858805 RepID=M5GD44_DACPD|nr:uncharacterized protein DACRYDRAFT_105308 [Dacryopinax primogenitus]EJU04242.1 hypothetical protein DACRYDRAFT_105308 [Dacryopinax primogenitus]
MNEGKDGVEVRGWKVEWMKKTHPAKRFHSAFRHSAVVTLPTIVAVMAGYPSYRDPWAKREAWRKSYIFTRAYYLRNLFPGLGTAIVAFTAYVAYDNLRMMSNSSKKEVEH